MKKVVLGSIMFFGGLLSCAIMIAESTLKDITIDGSYSFLWNLSILGLVPVTVWDNANSHFDEVEHLAKKDDKGNLLGIWGAMSDFSRAYKPWENFSQGLYLAGVECSDDSEAPNGWTKWVIPGYEYIYVENKNDNTFQDVITYLVENDISLAGAVNDFSCPKTGRNYMYFPIRRL